MSWLLRLLGTLVALLLLAGFCILPLGWREQAIVGLLFLALALIMNRRWRSHRVTLVLMSMSVFSSVRYIYYRIQQTVGARNTSTDYLSVEFICVILLLMAECYAILVLLLGYFQTIRPLRRNPVPMPDDINEWPTVDIYIPTYNEPLPVVRPTVMAALNMDWPADKFQVYILDDGRREEFRDFAEEAGANYIVREDNKYAKAGNINHALAQTNGEYVAIFDSDHIPTRSFLQITLGWFLKDSALAMLQTPHHFYSPDPFERNLGQFRVIPNEGELFYGVVQDGNDLWNSTFFCGSCAVLRRTALDDIGGVAVETVTEDAHTAFRMHRRGWNTAYINIPQAAGLATETLAGHIGQRIRWARGMVQILRLELPMFARGLTWAQRICYTNACSHFLYALPRLIFLTAPLVYLIFGRINIYGYSLAILAYALPHLTLSNITNSRIQGRHRFSFWNEIYETVLTPYILYPTWLALINPKLGKFNVTAKGGSIDRTYFDFKIARPMLIFLGLNIVGLILAVPRYLWWNSFEPGTVFMNTAWTIYNTVLLGAGLAVAWEARQQRRNVRIDLSVPIMVRTPDGREMLGSSVNISNGGVAVRLARTVDGGPLPLLPSKSTVQFFFTDLYYDVPFNTTVVGSGTSSVRLQFENMTIEQEEILVRVMYSRADSWLGWRSMEEDRPLRSWAHIAGIAMRTIFTRAPLTGETSRAGGPRPQAMPAGPSTANGSTAPNGTNGTAPSRAGGVTVRILLLGLLLLTTLLPRVAAAQGLRRRLVRQPAAVAAATPATAATAGPGRIAIAPQAEFTETYDLATLSNRPLDALFSKLPTDKDDDARVVVNFSVPVNKIVTRAVVSIKYFVPRGYENEQWAFYIVLNGVLIQTVPVRTGVASTLEVELPADALGADNEIILVFCSECKDLSDKIEITSATLRVSGVRLAVADDLRLLPSKFFEGHPGTGFSVPIAFATQPDNATLEAAGIVASWLGSVSDYHGVRFPTTVGALPKGNVILLARDSDPIDPSLRLEGGSYGLLALRANPTDPYGKVLVISGTDGEVLRNVARYLATTPDLSGSNAQVPGVVQFAAVQPYSSPRWLNIQSGELGTELERSRWTVTGERHIIYCRTRIQCTRPWTRDIDVYFRLPPDLFFGVTEHVPITLKYRYTGMGLNAVLRVRLNGYQLNRIKLETTHSLDTVETTVIGLPVGQLQPYLNQVTLQLVYEYSDSNSAHDGTFLQLMSANVDLRNMAHYSELPKLQLFSEAGYPFTKYQDLSGAAVILPERPTAAEIGLYLDAMGLFGAQTGAAGTAVTVRRTTRVSEVQQKDLLIIGTRNDQPTIREWSRSMPIFDEATLETPEEKTFNFSLTHFRAWIRRWFPVFGGRREARVDTVLDNQIQADAVITGYESPLYPGRTVVLIALRNPDQAAELTGAMFVPTQRKGSVWGTVAVLRNGTFRSYDMPAHHYPVGALPPLLLAVAFFTKNYWLVPFVVLIFAVFLGSILEWSLERKARARLQLET
jgi:cellulose synthase (UDP-forming)